MKLKLSIFSILLISSITVFNIQVVNANNIIQLAQTPPSCNQPDLANFYNVPYPRTNSPAINILINCITSDPSVSGMIDMGQIYTYQEDYELINYTRGNRVCGADVYCNNNTCHAVNSCHYGGSTGTQGAEAVDFNANSGYTEAVLFEKLRKLISAGGNCSGQAKDVKLEGDHTHMSTVGCSYTSTTTTTQGTAVTLPNAIGGGESDVDVVTIMLRILQSALAVVDIFALFMFIWGGFIFLTSAGNQERIKKAKDTLIWATIGILVVTLSYTILKYIFEAVTKATS